MYTNLGEPKGMYVEDFVLIIEAEMYTYDEYKSGAAFVDNLLWRTLGSIADVSASGWWMAIIHPLGGLVGATTVARRVGRWLAERQAVSGAVDWLPGRRSSNMLP
jgi:hypothetical protein